MRQLFGSTVAWIEDQPEWLRPVLYGALAIPAFAIVRGGLLLIPLVAIVLLIRGEPIGRELLRLGQMIAIAMIGGALSGGVYSLVGRRVRSIPAVGPYLAGWVSCWPYVLIILAILRIDDGVALVAPLGRPESFALVVMTFWVGLLVGFFFLRKE